MNAQRSTRLSADVMVLVLIVVLACAALGIDAGARIYDSLS
jgi:hypothetical protein